MRRARLAAEAQASMMLRKAVFSFTPRLGPKMAGARWTAEVHVRVSRREALPAEGRAELRVLRWHVTNA